MEKTFRNICLGETPVCVEAGEETDHQRSSGIQDNRPPVPDDQFNRQLPHRLVFFQGSFSQDVFATRLSAVFLPRLDQLQRDSAVR